MRIDTQGLGPALDLQGVHDIEIDARERQLTNQFDATQEVLVVMIIIIFLLASWALARILAAIIIHILTENLFADYISHPINWLVSIHSMVHIIGADSASGWRLLALLRFFPILLLLAWQRRELKDSLLFIFFRLIPSNIEIVELLIFDRYCSNVPCDCISSITGQSYRTAFYTVVWSGSSLRCPLRLLKSMPMLAPRSRTGLLMQLLLISDRLSAISLRWLTGNLNLFLLLGRRGLFDIVAGLSLLIVCLFFEICWLLSCIMIQLALSVVCDQIFLILNILSLSGGLSDLWQLVFVILWSCLREYLIRSCSSLYRVACLILRLWSAVFVLILWFLASWV